MSPAAAIDAVGRSFRDAPEIDGEVIVKNCDAAPGTFVTAHVTAAEPYDLTAALSVRPNPPLLGDPDLKRTLRRPHGDYPNIRKKIHRQEARRNRGGRPARDAGLGELLTTLLHRALVRLGEPARIGDVARETGEEAVTPALARHIMETHPRRFVAVDRRWDITSRYLDKTARWSGFWKN